MAIATPTLSAVHVEIPHAAGHALYEGAVNWSACSAVAVECAIAGRENRIPDAGNAQRLWAAMKANAEVTGGGSGADIPDCVWALASRGYRNLDVRFTSAVGLDAIHQLLKDAGLAADPVILLVTNGLALPDNEANVHGHFVVSAGIDSAKGYLIQNGDTRTAIANQALYAHWPACSNVPTNWANWATLVAAQLYAVIRVKSNAAPKPVVTPPPAPTPAPTPAPVGAPVAAPQGAQVAQALASVQSAIAALEAAETALKA